MVSLIYLNDETNLIDFFFNLLQGLHKPNKQTVMPFDSVEEFFRTLPLKKVRHLGGKLGLTLTENLNCNTMGDIVEISERTLQQRFDQKTGLVTYCPILEIYVPILALSSFIIN